MTQRRTSCATIPELIKELEALPPLAGYVWSPTSGLPKTNYMKRQNLIGGENGGPLMAFDVRLSSMDFDAGSKLAEIHITFRDALGNFCGKRIVSSPLARGTMIISTPIQNGVTSKVTCSSEAPPMSRHDWGTNE